jgi:ribosomal-protein-alanine N-acetyltransferase
MTAADIDRVYEIACGSLEETYLREIFLLFINAWPAGQLVAVNAFGNVAGFISGAKLASGKASVQLLAVEQRYRRMGAGSRLLEELKFRASMEGICILQLEVREENADVVSFYRKRGFLPAERLESFYNNGGCALRMMCSVRGNS